MTARRRLSRALDRLPGGAVLKRGYRALRPLPARLSQTIERLQVRLTPVDARQLQALADVTAALDLDLPAPALLARLKPVMTRADMAHLLALLDFVADRRAAAPRIQHTRDLAPVEAPARRTIALISGEFPNPLHGGGTRVSDFLRLMSQHHDLRLFTVYTEHQDAAALAALRSMCGQIITADYATFEATTDGLVTLAGAGPIDVAHYEWPRALRHYRRAAAARHLYTCLEAVSLRLLLDLRRLPPGDPAWLPTLVALLNSLAVEVVDAAPLDACITLTERDAAFLARFNPAMPYYVVNHGVTLDEFALPDCPPEPLSLLFIGNYQHYPNEDAVRFYFREIDGRIRQRLPAVRVYIVGANPTPEILAHHDGDRVIVTGAVADFRPFVQRAAVCIAPLVTGAGLRTKVIQYAALRRPAVVTSLAAADLLFESGVDLLIADEPVAFAAHVVALLEDPARAQAMAAAAYATVARCYDNRRIVGQLYQLYDQLGVPADDRACPAPATGVEAPHA
ncbi:MAG: glycosyltransferase [Chloroflexi bacterium]|nr:glycosyltransferase [Chloroflexota bacterium]